MSVVTVRGQARSYRFPKQGQLRHHVDIDGDGSIRVHTGDTLLGYSMAIHGSPLHANEFARFDRIKRRLVSLPFDSPLKPGEIIVHLPTLNKLAGRNSPNHHAIPSTTPADHQRFLKTYLAKDLKLPSPVVQAFRDKCSSLSKVRIGLFMADLFQVLGAQTGRTVGFSAIANFGHILLNVVRVLGPALAPALALAAGVSGIIKSTNSRYQAVIFLAYTYGYTAKVFGHEPPQFSRKLAEMTAHQHTSFNRGNAALDADEKEARKLWVQHAGRGSWDVIISAHRANIQVESYQMILRSMCENDPTRLSKMISKMISQTMDPMQEIRLLQFVKNGCVYPK